MIEANDPFLALLDARLAELESAKRAARFHGHVIAGDTPGRTVLQLEDVCIDIGAAQTTTNGFSNHGAILYSPDQQHMIDDASRAAIAKLRAAGEWQEGDRLILRIIVHPEARHADAYDPPP